MSDRSFSIIARIKSFRYALAGFWFMLKTQHSAWVHLAATILVCGAGFALRVSAADWRWLIVAIVLLILAKRNNQFIKPFWKRSASNV
jgi:diacylglycerol kinase (ATP)